MRYDCPAKLDNEIKSDGLLICSTFVTISPSYKVCNVTTSPKGMLSLKIGSIIFLFMKSKCAYFAQILLTLSTNRRYKHFSKKTLIFLEIEQNLILLFATSYIK